MEPNRVLVAAVNVRAVCIITPRPSTSLLDEAPEDDAAMKRPIRESGHSSECAVFHPGRSQLGHPGVPSMTEVPRDGEGEADFASGPAAAASRRRDFSLSLSAPFSGAEVNVLAPSNAPPVLVVGVVTGGDFAPSGIAPPSNFLSTSVTRWPLPLPSALSSSFALSSMPLKAAVCEATSPALLSFSL
eukprot:CAMPEP_0113566210 /NCGR_PEP_ID=MMETSP0015_2-20120614/22599_1 /TAXON_ID=2838 /ORGANISM="Odontella" /LENGTH=186 /DNA_ID=CAMNT_0000468479 /DNA_START=1327 /DNA_END=1888 /DNA_ORIENTATION=- /assembly_acc=CAM_ASM_000160